MKRWIAPFALVAAGVLFAGCGGDNTAGAAPDGQVAQPTAAANPSPTPAVNILSVVLNEWTVQPDRPRIQGGQVTLVAANLGATLHDLVIVRSDAGMKDLAVAEDRADETKLNIVGRFQEFKSGEKEKQFTLAAGRYLLICNLPDHYERGMVAELTVQ